MRVEFRLRTSWLSPYIRKYVGEAQVMLIGAMYDVATGKVLFLEELKP